MKDVFESALKRVKQPAENGWLDSDLPGMSPLKIPDAFKPPREPKAPTVTKEPSIPKVTTPSKPPAQPTFSEKQVSPGVTPKATISNPPQPPKLTPQPTPPLRSAREPAPPASNYVAAQFSPSTTTPKPKPEPKPEPKPKKDPWAELEEKTGLTTDELMLGLDRGLSRSNRVAKKEHTNSLAANFDYGQLQEESLDAMADYVNDRSPRNKKKIEKTQANLNEFVEKNQEVLGSGSEWFNTGAAYVPQMLNQLDAGVKGGAVGGGTALVLGQLGPQIGIPEEIVTVPTAAKAGYTAAVTKHSYDRMKGAAFYNLVQLGVDEETALKIAKDEALISASIEAIGTLRRNRRRRLFPSGRRCAQDSPNETGARTRRAWDRRQSRRRRYPHCWSVPMRWAEPRYRGDRHLQTPIRPRAPRWARIPSRLRSS